MDKKTLKALKKSIRKWEKIVAGEGEDRGCDNCALCKLFAEYECAGCPVYVETGETSCQGTPFHEWARHHEEKHLTGVLKIKCPECKELAQKELEFLKSLLPEKVIERD